MATPPSESLDLVIKTVRETQYFKQLCEHYRKVDLQQLVREDTQHRMWANAQGDRKNLVAVVVYLYDERYVPSTLVIAQIAQERQVTVIVDHLTRKQQDHPFIPSPQQPRPPRQPMVKVPGLIFRS